MKSSSTVTALSPLRGGSETRVLSRNDKDLGKKFQEVKDSIAALDVQNAIIDYAVSRFTPHPARNSYREALHDAA